MNTVNISGRLTADVTKRFTNSQKAVASFKIANDVGYGEKKKTSFLSCVAWNNTADYVEKYAHKGDEVFITGRISQRSYEKSDGSKAEAVEIVVDEIKIIGKKKSDDVVEEPQNDKPVFADLEEDEEGDLPF